MTAIPNSDRQGSTAGPRWIEAQRHLRAALDALGTDPDDHDDPAENALWEDLLTLTEKVEDLMGVAHPE